MKLFVPAIGTKLKLTEPWTFKLHAERRNHDLITTLPGQENRNRWGYYNLRGGPIADVTLQEGTILVVDRIYIRKGAEDFDSITFRVAQSLQFPKKKPRFWAKLNDVNKIECEIVE